MRTMRKQTETLLQDSIRRGLIVQSNGDGVADALVFNGAGVPHWRASDAAYHAVTVIQGLIKDGRISIVLHK